MKEIKLRKQIRKEKEKLERSSKNLNTCSKNHNGCSKNLNEGVQKVDTHNNNNRQASASIKKIKAFPKVYNIKKDVNQNEKSREDEEGPHITKIFRKAKK